MRYLPARSLVFVFKGTRKQDTAKKSIQIYAWNQLAFRVRYGIDCGSETGRVFDTLTFPQIGCIPQYLKKRDWTPLGSNGPVSIYLSAPSPGLNVFPVNALQER